MKIKRYSVETYPKDSMFGGNPEFSALIEDPNGDLYRVEDVEALATEYRRTPSLPDVMELIEKYEQLIKSHRDYLAKGDAWLIRSCEITIAEQLNVDWAEIKEALTNKNKTSSE
jgi:hypothetical protein